VAWREMIPLYLEVFWHLKRGYGRIKDGIKKSREYLGDMLWVKRHGVFCGVFFFADNDCVE
jgi:hypothetical protein